MKEPRFLSLPDVLELHRQQLRLFGGRDGIRDQGLLESALEMPKASFGGRFLHPTLFEMAAAYAYHIAENQPFVDGNKRAGLDAALVFLHMNGVPLEDPAGSLYEAMIGLGTRKLTKSGFAGALKALADR